MCYCSEHRAGLKLTASSQSGVDSLGSVWTTGTRYFSVAHCPRSINLQRSLQKGRQRFSGVHTATLLQVGQVTFRGVSAGLFTG